MTHIYHIPDSCDDHPGWNGAPVTKRARCIRANNADEYTVCGTNTWIVAEPDAGAALIVDPGPAESAHLDGRVHRNGRATRRHCADAQA